MSRLKFYIKKFHEKDEEQFGLESQADNQPDSPMTKLNKLTQSPGLNKKTPAKHQMMNGMPQPVVEQYSEPSSLFLPNVVKLKQQNAEVEARTPMLQFKTFDDIIQLKRFIPTKTWHVRACANGLNKKLKMLQNLQFSILFSIFIFGFASFENPVILVARWVVEFKEGKGFW